MGSKTKRNRYLFRSKTPLTILIDPGGYRTAGDFLPLLNYSTRASSLDEVLDHFIDKNLGEAGSGLRSDIFTIRKTNLAPMAKPTLDLLDGLSSD